MSGYDVGMATLGIIGGIAPPSTVLYYRKVVEVYRARTDGRAPRVLINSLDGDDVYDRLTSADTEGLAAVLLDGIRQLFDGGADIALLASASVHVVYEWLKEESPLPLIGIVDATVDACSRHRRLGLLATGFTARANLFGPRLADRGITLVIPNDREQDDIHRIYFDELVAGCLRSTSRGRILQIAHRMRAEDLVDGVLLAGTELPLLLPQEQYDGLPFIDTTRAHIEAAVAAMLTR